MPEDNRTTTLEVELRLVEDGVASFYALEKEKHPGKSELWCEKEKLPEDWVEGGVFRAEVDLEEAKKPTQLSPSIKELKFLKEKTREHKVGVARRMIKSEDKVKKSSNQNSSSVDRNSE